MTASASGAGGPVRVTMSDAVATLTWSRPSRRNAIGLEICRLLTDELERLHERADIAVIHLDSADGPFCSGFDLTDLGHLDGADTADRPAFFAAGRALLTTLAASPQVTLASPRTYALGFGCAVLSRCDLVIAPDDATFGIPEIRAGVVPTTVLPDLLGVMPERIVRAWALDGRRHTAHEAMLASLVTAVVPTARIADEAAGVLTELARRPQLVRETKAAIRDIAAAPAAERVPVAIGLAVAHAAARATAGVGT